MKVICEGINLSEAILKVVKACATRTTVPLLECIKLTAKNDSLTLLATDGEISIQKSIKAEVLEEGEICVPGKYFNDFIKKLENAQITLIADGGRMEIKYDDSQTSMQVLSAEDFPKVSTDLNENRFTMKSEDLKRVISSTSFCCAADDSRPNLKGCQFIIEEKSVCVTALDGFRLATCTAPIISSTGDMEIICPARTLNEIEKMIPSEGETEIFIQKGMILVSVDDTVLTSRLYGGDFIKKENIIPKAFSTTVTVDKVALLSSIQRAAILVRSDKNNLIIFDISSGMIEVSSNSDIGNVQEPVKAQTEGKDIRIAMNSKFIEDAVSSLEEDEVVLSFNSGIQPFICNNKENKDILYLILPVRTANNA
ncbi:MAG: DNA polymerase III subunit beta [Clostridia bacterium]|nr:DNA polymerase III subunit beta [Clostridia bacterium]